MRIQDISLGKRLLGANFLMVCVPICAILLLGTILLAAFHFTGADQPASLALLWPERGPSFFVQYITSDIRVQAQKAVRKNKKLGTKDIIKDCRQLEQQGLRTAIRQNGKILYVTEGSDAMELFRQAAMRSGDNDSIEIWDGNNFVFRYYSPQHDATIVALGQLPLPAAAEEGPWSFKNFIEIVLWLLLLLSVGSILIVGRWLSRTLSQQILEPLQELRIASEAIRRGDFGHVLPVFSRDEVGRVCADFEEMRKELRQAKEERIRYENNRKELIAGISHDLRTPLTAIRGYVSGLRDGIAHTPEKKKHYLDMVYESILTLERLVENLFLFSKLDLKQVPFRLEAVHLPSWLEAYVRERQEETIAANMVISIESDVRDAVVDLDVLQFQRVIQNLWENSRKYAKDDKTIVDIRLSEVKKQIEIRWQDHGKGVDEKQLPRLFKHFYRTDEARGNVADGSGLGLAISKEIIQGMKGTIIAQPTPGGGLTILIRLPLSKEKGECHEKDFAD